MSYRLLDSFQTTFQGKRYIHRDSSRGDFVAIHLYEDLHTVARSALYRRRVDAKERVLNIKNRRRGEVGRGELATVEIGVEVKILAKAMIKQIDRVIGDLVKQVAHFRRGAGTPICVGVVGINSALVCTRYEGARKFTTDGKKHKHPFQEAAEAEARLIAQAKPSFDEFLVLRYRATNAKPYGFEWVDLPATELDYGAILTRISREYDRRFKNGGGADGA